ncbi:pectate lyase [Sarracenia purpurea var. burkii]
MGARKQYRDDGDSGVVGIRRHLLLRRGGASQVPAGEALVNDPHFFERVKVFALALLKMVVHARSDSTIEVMGLMQGKSDGDAIIVIDAFALPVEGTETRVNAQAGANEFMVDYSHTNKQVNNVIIHGLQIHHCRSQPPGEVMGPDGKIQQLGHIDGDAIRLVSASKVWLDHNTLYSSQDGLIDVTRGSSNVTISNNWFKNQNKVMLLGHDDGYLRDVNMKVTVAFNRFGPDCHQRMPRVRYGYAHVVNNLYQGWGLYAIGGSMNPSVKSQANLFVAPKSGKKEVTWKKNYHHGMSEWKFKSVKDVFENGACFQQTGDNNSGVEPHYNHEQGFPVADARSVRVLTRNSGALNCPKRSRC